MTNVWRCIEVRDWCLWRASTNFSIIYNQ